MLGERTEQRGLWEADRLYIDHVGRESFYGLLTLTHPAKAAPAHSLSEAASRRAKSWLRYSRPHSWYSPFPRSGGPERAERFTIRSGRSRT